VTTLNHTPGGQLAALAAGVSAPSPVSLTDQQLKDLAQARTRSKKIRRAGLVASMDAWTTACFAGLTLLGNLSGFALPATLLGIGMCVVSFHSFRGRRLLQNLDPAAPQILGYNQLFFTICLLVYGACSLYQSMSGPAPFADTIAAAPETKDILLPYQDMARTLNLVVAVCVIGAGVIATTSASLYYFSRAKTLRTYIEQTPHWILEMHRAGFSL
jgi:hypothetical protein